MTNVKISGEMECLELQEYPKPSNISLMGHGIKAKFHTPYEFKFSTGVGSWYIPQLTTLLAVWVSLQIIYMNRVTIFVNNYPNDLQFGLFDKGLHNEHNAINFFAIYACICV